MLCKISLTLELDITLLRKDFVFSLLTSITSLIFFQTAVEFRRLQREREEREHRRWQMEMQQEAEKAMELERLEIDRQRQQQVSLPVEVKVDYISYEIDCEIWSSLTIS